MEFLDVYQPVEKPAEPECSYSMTLPQTIDFKDLHGGMVENFPNFTMERLEEFLDQYDQKLDKKIIAIYNERLHTI